jgi:hypothetical protein
LFGWRVLRIAREYVAASPGAAAMAIAATTSIGYPCSFTVPPFICLLALAGSVTTALLLLLPLTGAAALLARPALRLRAATEPSTRTPREASQIDGTSDQWRGDTLLVAQESMCRCWAAVVRQVVRLDAWDRVRVELDWLTLAPITGRCCLRHQPEADVNY